KACATRPVAKALRRMRTIASCPIRSLKLVGRYLRASTRYGVACTGSGAVGASPNRPGPSGGGGASIWLSSWHRPAMRGRGGRRAGPLVGATGWEAGRPPRAEPRCGCFLPDLTGLARRPSAADLPPLHIMLRGGGDKAAVVR